VPLLINIKRLKHFTLNTARWKGRQPITPLHTHHLWFWPVCSLMWKHGVIHKTRSTVHNTLHCRQRKTRPGER